MIGRNIRLSEVNNNYFQELYNIDVREKTKQKNGLNYLSWSDAYAEVKKKHPDATYKIYEQILEVKDGMVLTTRPWFDDGRTGWVKVSVTINGIEAIEELPIMNYSNKPIAAGDITSVDANKSVQRALTKACGRHGLGLYLYSGEDMPEEVKKEEKKKAEEKSELQMVNEESFALAKKLSATEKFKTKIPTLCKSYHPSGNPRKVADLDQAKKLLEELQNMSADI